MTTAIRSFWQLWFSACCLTVWTIACQEDVLAPEDLAGTYSATLLTATQGTQVTDVLAAGGSLTVTLTSSGNTTGQLFVPASVAGGSDLIANMVGTFRVSGTVVQFHQTADTFVRDMDFLVVGNTLTGTGSFNGTTVAVTLTRS